MSDEMYEHGLSIRREVVGAEYVDRSLAQADEFTKPLQDLVTEYCWGRVWGRDGLPRSTRSLLNVAMLTALNRPHELKLHVTGALRNGCSADDIREVLCSKPRSIAAFPPRSIRSASPGKRSPSSTGRRRDARRDRLDSGSRSAARAG
jgi:4-carboxymuconolactone decarboxylase